MKTFKGNKPFQIRWNEPLGKDDCIYGYRWMLIFFGYSIRLHKWIQSEPIAHQHDHVWNFLIITLFGGYIDVSTNTTGDIILDKVKTGSIRYRIADHRHNIVLAKNTVCWSLLFTSKSKDKNWGFFVNNKKFRPLRYFSRYGYLKTCRDN